MRFRPCLRRLLLLSLLAGGVTGCGAPAGEPDVPATGQTVPADTATAPARDAEGPALTPGGAVAVPPARAHHFDPAALRPGDEFLGLRVVEHDVRRVFDDSVWAGRVRFAGELALTGEYGRHFDYPEPAELCFRVAAPSIARVPAFAPDAWTSPNMITWFCFTNPDDARRLLGTGVPPRTATVVVDDYLVVREFSDVYATARLLRVVDPPY